VACGGLGARVDSLAVFGGFVSHSVAKDQNLCYLVSLLLAKETVLLLSCKIDLQNLTRYQGF